MTTTKVLRSEDSQVVLLPRAFDFPPEVNEVVIRRVGLTLVIASANALWGDFFEATGVDLGDQDQAVAG